MKRPSQASVAAQANTGCPDPELLRMYPCIVAYLTDGQWEDKKPRELSSLTVSIAGGMVQVGLNDKALSRSAYTSAGMLDEALQLMEDALREEVIQWRTWKLNSSTPRGR